MLLILNTVHSIFNLAVHNRACLDIVSLPYYTGNKMWCCHAWVNNHCFINIDIKIYTKTHRLTETKTFFPFMCKTKVSASVVIIFDCILRCLLYLLSFYCILHLSPNFTSPLFGLISPLLLHYFLLLSFLLFSSHFFFFSHFLLPSRAPMAESPPFLSSLICLCL